jgi:hypothetical protein
MAPRPGVEWKEVCFGLQPQWTVCIFTPTGTRRERCLVSIASSLHGEGVSYAETLAMSFSEREEAAV